MEIFGEKSLFAICFELDQYYGGSWLFGKFCYWIDGVQVGKYELGTSLRDVLFTLTSVVKDNSHRQHSSLFKLPTDELFNRLSIALYGEDTQGYEEISTKEMWARFDVLPRVDVFDNWKVFMVDSSEKSRLLYKYLEHVEETEIEKGVSEFHLPLGVFDRVIHSAHTALNNIYEEEIRKEGI